jgi:hypothetical protein
VGEGDFVEGYDKRGSRGGRVLRRVLRGVM